MATFSVSMSFPPAELHAFPVIRNPRLHGHLRPRAARTLPQPLRDQGRLIVTVEIRVVLHGLLHADDVGVEACNRLDRLLEVVVGPADRRPCEC
jgi:hypothetical protein